MKSTAPLSLPPRFELRVDGERGGLVYDPVTRASWQVSTPTLDLLRAMREGWSPGASLPDILRPYADHLGPDSIDQVLEGLADQGLLTKHQADVIETWNARFSGEWKDLRLRIITLPALPERYRAPALRVAAALPLLLAVTVIASVILTAARPGTGLMAVWTTHRAALGGLRAFGVQLAAVLGMTVVHEVGHALVLAAAGVGGTPIGVRIAYFLLPSAFTDARAVYALPDRSARITVLLGGMAAELTLWAALATWAYLLPSSAPAVLVAAVLFAGPVSLLRNLLIPFFGSDGYFILGELTGIRNLSYHARTAALRTFIAPGEGTSEPSRAWWLPWYGMVHWAIALLFIGIIFTALGTRTGYPGAAAVAGLFWTLLYLTIQRRTLSRGPA